MDTHRASDLSDTASELDFAGGVPHAFAREPSTPTSFDSISDTDRPVLPHRVLDQRPASDSRSHHVLTNLSLDLAVLPGEAELVFHHMKNLLADLLSDRPR